MATSKEFVSGHNLPYIVFSHTQQANILMTNDSPPRPCLADFGFVNLVSEPRNAIDNLPILTLEGSSMTFMAPELFAPSDSGPTTTVLTKEGDIYAFGLVILQVIVLYHRYLLFILNILSGPDRRTTVSERKPPRTRFLRVTRWSPRQTHGCRGHWDL